MPPKKSTPTKTVQAKRKTSTGKPKNSATKVLKGKTFPIVGLGASAGGLAALKKFFSKVPKNSGMAYIVVVHMASKQPSMMPELIQRAARLPVSTAKDGQSIERGNIYVVPPNKEITVYKGSFQLLDIVKRGVPHPIDLFLRSLAHDQMRNAVAIILSGTGTDGSLMIKEINANEGVVLFQSETSADYNGMPRSAISTGLVDMVLPPDEMHEKLQQYFTRTKSSFLVRKSASNAADKQQDWLKKIFAILHTQTDHDFSVYKVDTLLHRVSRRMGMHQIESHDTVRYLRENPTEVETLFRDPESFDVLKATVFPEYIDRMTENDTFRAGFPGVPQARKPIPWQSNSMSFRYSNQANQSAVVCHRHR